MKILVMILIIVLQMPIRGNVAYDKADKVKWSPDSKGKYSIGYSLIYCRLTLIQYKKLLYDTYCSIKLLMFQPLLCTSQWAMKLKSIS